MGSVLRLGPSKSVMPKTIITTEEIEIPDGVSVTFKARVVTVKGPRGTLTKQFKHLHIDIKKAGPQKIIVEKWFAGSRQASAVRTVSSHIKNMITGVTVGFEYKMRFVYAHFPINFTFVNNNKTIEIRNFIGEKRVRRVTAQEGCTMDRTENKDEIKICGNDIDAVSVTAAQISQCSQAKHKDIRKFLDGIYVIEKGNIEN